MQENIAGLILGNFTICLIHGAVITILKVLSTHKTNSKSDTNTPKRTQVLAKDNMQIMQKENFDNVKSCSHKYFLEVLSSFIVILSVIDSLIEVFLALHFC
jgi:hypothetical protein